MKNSTPSNPHAEKLLLAGFLRHPGAILEYCTWLDDDDFSKRGHAMLFESMQSLVLNKEAQKLSKAKIVAEANSLGHGNAASAMRDALDELFGEEVTPEDIKTQFIEVKKQAYKRRVFKTFKSLEKYMNETSDPLHKVIGTVEDQIVSQVELLDQGDYIPLDLGEGAIEYVTKLSENPGHVGLDVGLPIWQSRIGQVKNGSVSFVAATAKAGKSQFALKSAIMVAHRMNLPVFLADSELNKEAQQLRLVGILAEVPYDVIENGYWNMPEKELREENFTDEQIGRFAEYRKRMENKKLHEIVAKLPIKYFKCSGLSIPEVLPHIRRWLLTTVKPDREASVPQCLLIYDYIKLATVDELRGGKLAEYQVHGLNVAALHDFVNRFNIPCVAFGQTNREIDDDVNCIAGCQAYH